MRRISRLSSTGTGVILIVWQCFHHVLAAQGKPSRPPRNVPAAEAPTALTIRLQDRLYSLSTEQGLHQLQAALAESIDRHQRRERASEQARRQLLGDRSLAELPIGDLKLYYSRDLAPDKKQRRALLALRDLTARALLERDPFRKATDLRSITEIAQALSNSQRPPLPSHVDSLAVPIVFWNYWHHAIGHGQAAASNLAAPGPEGDLSRADPSSSTFWTRPQNLAAQDLFNGFGRSAPPDLAEPLWDYHGPKTGYGTSPGFELRSALGTVKAKFAETRSEPFAARIFWALGYEVEPTDHVPQLRVRYDRRILREFNLRRDLVTHVTTFLVPSYAIRIQKHYDPFAFIAAAVMQDGRQISGAELKRQLFYDPALEHPEDWPANFNRTVEDKIDCLITVPANVHLDPRRHHSIGSWDFDEAGHADLRELRGAALLAGWLGWFDCRFLNTRLELDEGSDGWRLRHAITDLGSCLGKGSGLTSRTCERPEEFSGSFTRPLRVQGPGQMTIPFRMTGYQPIEDPGAFRRMTIDDARWMGRLIGALTEQQIGAALLAAGFDPTQRRLYLEKLISRRNRMIRDLGLASEIPLLRTGDGARR